MKGIDVDEFVGMSCAHHLSNHPDKFDVTVVDAVDYCGGQAFSIPVDKEKTGASWLNQGVQGGSYIFHHTLTMFARNGFWADPVRLQVSFGKSEQFWTNVFPTQMLKKHEKEVRRFYYMLKIVRMFEVFFALLPIKYLVKLFWFSEEFANIVALPMIALFLGTGNYTPEVPSMILERLCTSPTYGMWNPPDKASLVSNVPPMVVFPNFSDFYETWRKNLSSRGVNIRLSTEVTRVLKRDKTGVKVNIIKRTPVSDGHNPDSAWVPDTVDGSNADADAKEATEEYDEIVLCVLTDTAKRLLQPSITSIESRVLGSAKFANDITVTHQDTDYMSRHYENFYNRNSPSPPSTASTNKPAAMPPKRTSKPCTSSACTEKTFPNSKCASTAQTTSRNSHPPCPSTNTSSKPSSSIKNATPTSGPSTRSTPTKSSAKIGGTNSATPGRTTSSSCPGCGSSKARGTRATPRAGRW